MSFSLSSISSSRVLAFGTTGHPRPTKLSLDGEIAKLEKPQRFENYVYRALAEGLIPANKAANLVKKSLADVERAVKGPE